MTLIYREYFSTAELLIIFLLFSVLCSKEVSYILNKRICLCSGMILLYFFKILLYSLEHLERKKIVFVYGWLQEFEPMMRFSCMGTILLCKFGINKWIGTFASREMETEPFWVKWGAVQSCVVILQCFYLYLSVRHNWRCKVTVAVLKLQTMPQKNVSMYYLFKFLKFLCPLYRSLLATTDSRCSSLCSEDARSSCVSSACNNTPRSRV